MRVYLGSDHAGFELKSALIQWLATAGHEAVDCGPAGYDPQDDYPVYVMRAANGVASDPGSLGGHPGAARSGRQGDDPVTGPVASPARRAQLWTRQQPGLFEEAPGGVVKE